MNKCSPPKNSKDRRNTFPFLVIKLTFSMIICKKQVILITVSINDIGIHPSLQFVFRGISHATDLVHFWAWPMLP